jgi:hypothetical protein
MPVSFLILANFIFAFITDRHRLRWRYKHVLCSGLQKILDLTLLRYCFKQFSRTVFWDSSALRLPYEWITIDSPEELGIILCAWHFRTSRSNTPLV